MFHVALVLAATFVPGPLFGASDHEYQVVEVVGNAGAPFSWTQADAFARSRVVDGHRGHLLTLETRAEYESPPLPKLGYLGAARASDGAFRWTNGPLAGIPVSFFAPLTPGDEASCGPFARLCLAASAYEEAPEVSHLPGPLPACGCAPSFVIEYEADTVAPQVTVLAPDAGDRIVAGSDAVTTLSWMATDNEGVIDVDLALSRTGPDGPYETLAAHVANTGLYAWPAEGPAAQGTAYLRVTARDEAGNAGVARSAAGFSIVVSVSALPATWGRIKALYRVSR
jgi:hypothetical protein